MTLKEVIKKYPHLAEMHLEEYLVSSRWRINALREWLFFEVEPFVTWRKDEQFATSYGISLRVEGFFGQT